MKISAAIQEFLQYLQFEKRFSRHTVNAYSIDLYGFSEYLLKAFEVDKPGAVSPAIIRSWLARLKDEGLESRTINRKISALRSFYKFLKQQGYTAQNPLKAIKALKTPSKIPSFLTEAEISALFTLLKDPVTWQDKLVALAIPLLYATGLRRSELLQLQIKNIDFHLNQLRVLGKGNKERLIPLQKQSLQGIREYLEIRQKEIGPYNAGALLLCTEEGEPLAEKIFYNMVHEALGRVSTLEQRSPHILRHTFATHLANAGADLNAVKELLGHNSLASTQVYTHNTIEKLKNAHKQAHPRG